MGLGEVALLVWRSCSVEGLAGAGAGADDVAVAAGRSGADEVVVGIFGTGLGPSSPEGQMGTAYFMWARMN